MVFLSAFLLAACGGGYEARNEKFMASFKKGEYESAGKILYVEVPGLAGDDRKKESYLGGLQCGAGFMWAGQDELAQQCFAAADQAMFDSKMTSYDPLEFEKIMLKTYQGAAALSASDQFARQFFNQAYYLQTQSVDAAAKQIADMEKEFKKSAAKIPGMPSLDSIVAEADKEFSQNAQVAAMSDFVNPYATWLSAIYAGLNGDMSNAENYLRRVMVFAPDNKFVATDIAALKSGQGHVWVVLEDGLVGHRTTQKLAPRALQQWKINLSIPDITKGSSAVKKLEVKSGKETATTQPLADITRIAKTDLSKFRRRDITASVIFEIAKVAAAGTAFIVAESAAHNNARKNNLGGAMALSLAGRGALAVIMSQEKDWETRDWTSLPNTISVARVAMPKNRFIEISGVDEKVRIPSGAKNAIVIVRIPLQTAKPGIIIGQLN